MAEDDSWDLRHDSLILSLSLTSTKLSLLMTSSVIVPSVLRLIVISLTLYFGSRIPTESSISWNWYNRSSSVLTSNRNLSPSGLMMADSPPSCAEKYCIYYLDWHLVYFSKTTTDSRGWDHMNAVVVGGALPATLLIFFPFQNDLISIKR